MEMGGRKIKDFSAALRSGEGVVKGCQAARFGQKAKNISHSLSLGVREKHKNWIV